MMGKDYTQYNVFTYDIVSQPSFVTEAKPGKRKKKMEN